MSLVFTCPLVRLCGQSRAIAAHELLDVYSRARDLLTDDASVREQMNVLYGLWIIHFSRSEHAAAHALAQDCLARSMRHQHTDFPALAHSLMGNALWADGRVPRGTLSPGSVARAVRIRASQHHRVPPCPQPQRRGPLVPGFHSLATGLSGAGSRSRSRCRGARKWHRPCPADGHGFA